MTTGLGLGLYSVKKYVSKLKGLVRIDSVENEFTTITILIPNEKF
jgi:sensor histidine kinase regulating citrate/malate metabolism